MIKPDKQLEADFNKIGVFIMDKGTVKGERLLTLLVQVGFPKSTEISAPEFDIKVMTKRGVCTYFRDFQLLETEAQTIFQFETCQVIPDDLNLPVNSPNLMSFVDFCWYAGNEPVNADLIPDVFTVKMPNYKSGDLGWYLPSRFVDSVISSLGKLNDVFLSGTLEDAILYGPYIKDER